eukprot:4026636-Amphidinium_carterae.1
MLIQIVWISVRSEAGSGAVVFLIFGRRVLLQEAPSNDKRRKRSKACARVDWLSNASLHDCWLI